MGKAKPFSQTAAPPDMVETVLRLQVVEALPLLAVGLVVLAGVSAVPAASSVSPGRAASRWPTQLGSGFEILAIAM